MNIKIDRVLFDPTEAYLQLVVDETTKAINKNCKVRLAPHLPVLEVFKSPTGRIETNGGGVPKSWIIRGEVHSTSRIGVAWWTDAAKRKHVRVVGDRDLVNCKSVNSIFGYPTLHDFWCVYPKAQYTKSGLVIIMCGCGRKVTLEDLDWDGEKCGVCKEIEKYEEETGFKPGRT